MKKLFLIICLFIIPACENDSKQTQLKELTKVCSKLRAATKKNYEVVTGTFLFSGHQHLEIASGIPYVIVSIPISDKLNTSVSFGTPSDKMEQFHKKLYEIIDKETLDNKIDIDENFAFCGAQSPYIKDRVVYNGEIETLIILENNE